MASAPRLRSLGWTAVLGLALIGCGGSGSKSADGGAGSGGHAGSSSAGAGGHAGGGASAGAAGGSAGATAGSGGGAAGADGGAGAGDASGLAGSGVDGSADGGTTIPTTGGTATGPMGSKVVVPAGALASATNISIDIVTSGFPATDASIQKYSAIYAFTPHGQQFLMPVTVMVPFSGTSTGTLYTADPAGTWHIVSGATSAAGAMSAQVSHFSFFYVGSAASDGGTSDAATDGATDSTADAGSTDSSDSSAATDAASDTGSDGSAASLTCGSIPTSAITVQALVTGTLPSSVLVTSTLCAQGTNLAMPVTPGNGANSATGVLTLGQTPQFMTLTASDGSAVPLHSPEFTSPGYPAKPSVGTPGAFVGLLYAKTIVTQFAAPGFTSGGTTALINIVLTANSTCATGTAGTTISLVGTAHPEAMVYYQTSNGWSANGPSAAGKSSVSIVLTPASAGEYVQVQGTNAGCTVDTGVAAGALRTDGFSGRVPIFAGEMSQVQAFLQ